MISWCIDSYTSTEVIIQGGPERMQRLWSLILKTSSIKLFFILLGRKFIFQQNDTMTIEKVWVMLLDTRAILSNVQCRYSYNICYSFDRSDPCEQQLLNVWLHSVPENQLMRNAIALFVHIVIVYSSKCSVGTTGLARWGDNFVEFQSTMWSKKVLPFDIRQ